MQMVGKPTAGVAALALVGLLGACGGGSSTVGGHGSTGDSAPGSATASKGVDARTAPKVPSAPHYASVRVGKEPYVNACRAYSGNGSVISAFDKYIPTNAVIQVTYAENSLPASWYTTPTDKLTSSCTVELADPPWNSATIIFGIDQYGSPALAQAAFTQYKPESQAELDKVNKRFGTDLRVSPNNTTTIPGLAGTYFSPSAGVSYTLVGNKIVSFNGGTVVPKTQYLAALRTAVPRAVGAVKASNLQAETASQDFGKHIGASTYRNPCAIFTSAAFTKATKLTADPTAVGLIYNASAVLHPRSVEPDGIADNTCERQSLNLGKQQAANLEVEIGYFTSPAQALQQMKVRRNEHASQVKSVSGMGSGAYTFTYAGVTALTVARGPYTLTVSGSTVTGGKRTDGPLGLLTATVSATAPLLGR